MTPISPATLQAALALNNDHAVELSLQSPEAFRTLVDAAFLACWTTPGEAFLIAFDQDGDYASDNFLWFRSRFSRFVYVDRIVVAPAHRGRGLAKALYAQVFAAARAAGHMRVVCEVNAAPPNPASDAFHAALGFTEIGSARLSGSAKTVRYLSCALPPEGR
jgi:hypothetical protein